MSEWKETTIGEIAEVKTGPFGSALLNEQYIQGGTPVITVEHIKDFRISQLDYPSVTNEDKERLSSYTLEEGDIVFSRVGSVDLSAIALKENEGWLFSSRMLRVRPERELIDPLFLSYYLRLYGVRKYINNIAVGSTMPSINTQILKSIPIFHCELSEQKEIAKTLSNLDQKITLLREQNQTLEELAQTLFKRWFIEFEFPNENGEPYKSSGGKMEESELGEIPEGWEVAYLNTFISDSIGGDYGKEEPIGDFTEEATCLRGTDLPDMKTGLPERAPVRFIKAVKLKKCKLNNGDIVIEISGGTEGQSTGRAIYINDQILSHYSKPITCVNFCRILRTRALEFSYFTYLFLDFLYARGVFFNLENGSTGIKNLDLKTLLNDYELPIPPPAIVKQFDSSVNGLFKKIQENNKEIQSLTQLRDTLLPKLMSGELRVKE